MWTLLNQIQQMCRRTFRANLFSVQSDCPHRERFGYGGDIVATSEALMMNFDMAGFYAKTANDWADGATTLWEHWAFNANTYTHNHPMFGSVSQWFIQWLGGIQPDPDAVGFDRIVIRPQTVTGLTWVRSSYDSVRGRIVSHWRRENGRLYFEIHVPANTTARIFLPAQSRDLIREGGKPVGEAAGIAFVRVDGESCVYAAGSGEYQFEMPE